jgi:hypothetical protein
LSEEQFEELKKLIPDTCRIKGCCNNFNFGPGFPGVGDGKQTRGGICNFHRKYPNYKDEPYTQETPQPTPTPPSNNRKITTDPFKISKFEHPFGRNQVNLYPEVLTVNGQRVEVINIFSPKVQQIN